MNDLNGRDRKRIRHTDLPYGFATRIYHTILPHDSFHGEGHGLRGGIGPAAEDSSGDALFRVCRAAHEADMMPDGERTEGTAQNFDEVEPVKAVRGGVAEVVQERDRGAEVAAFLRVGELAPRFGASAELAQVTVARLHLDEHKGRTVEADQVEFAVRCAAIAQQDRVSHLREKPRGVAFPGIAEAFPPGAFPGGLPFTRGVLFCFAVRHFAEGA